MRLLLVRHAESQGNAANIYQGHQDYPLSALGRSQAQRLAQRLESTPLEALYSSDLSRARETVEPLQPGRDLEVVSSPLWREITFGEWEGLTYEEVQARDGRFWRAFHSDPTQATPPGGENVADVQSRVREGLAQIQRAHQEGNIAVVAHAGALRALLCHLIGIPLRNIWHLRLDLMQPVRSGAGPS